MSWSKVCLILRLLHIDQASWVMWIRGQICRMENYGWNWQWMNLTGIIQWSSNFLLIIHNCPLIHHLSAAYLKRATVCTRSKGIITGNAQVISVVRVCASWRSSCWVSCCSRLCQIFCARTSVLMRITGWVICIQTRLVISGLQCCSQLIYSAI